MVSDGAGPARPIVTAWEDFFGAAFAHDNTAHAEQGSQLVFANLAGLPAVTVPAGHDQAGLPIGVQIVGPRWSEIRLLEIATELEDAGMLPKFVRPPGY